MNRKFLYVSASVSERGAVDSGFIELMSDDELLYLNSLLPWQCFTIDSKGRRFGDKARSDKRHKPEVIPDPRILEMDRLFSLANKKVLEVGCFEGIHTIALYRAGAQIHAVDSRIENVLKTQVRTNLFACKANVALCDIESAEEFEKLPQIDILHHVGVLYHLKDPVSHLLSLSSKVEDGLLLCTHYATEEMLNGTYSVNEREYRYFQYAEKGRGNVFSGMYDHAKWLLLDDIVDLLAQLGFTDTRIMRNKQQRNGPRITLFSARPGIMANTSD